MVERVRIGELFGQKGVFVSAPGESVATVGARLLMDTRYEYLEVHQAGRLSLSRNTIPGVPHAAATTSVFSGQVSFPSLGYIPLAYASPLMVNSNYVTDGNTGWYPCMSGMQQPFATMPSADSDNLGWHLAGAGYQVSATKITFKAYYMYNFGDDDTEFADIDVDYIVFKNRSAA